MPVPLNIIKEKILEALPDAEVTVEDLAGDGDHLRAVVVSQAFEGKKLLEQHKMVMDPLKEILKDDLHALAVKTYTFEKWNNK